MRQTRIYHPGNYSQHDTILLSIEASHHLITVLRLPPETPITLFNGNNQEFSALLIDNKKKGALVYIQQQQTLSRESPIAIHLAQAIGKGDKMEWVIQKAVELGVTSITPIISQRTAYKLDRDKLEKKQAQWQAIAIGACEQSGRNYLPQINSALNFSDFIVHCPHQIKWLLDPSAKDRLLSPIESLTDITLAIGPEGGFSAEELAKAYLHNFTGKSLGPRILRTETAAIAALAILQAGFGDL